MIMENGDKLKDQLNIRLLSDFIQCVDEKVPILWIEQQETISPITMLFYDRALLWIEDIQVTVQGAKEEITWQ